MLRVLKYDLDSLPNPPFSVQFLVEGEVSPKRWFTVLEKRIHESGKKIELFIPELERYIDYNEESVQPVSFFFCN